MTPIQTYAVIDRTFMPNVLTACERHDCAYWCLLPEPVDEEFAAVAPYLVQVNEALMRELIPQTMPWGFLLEAYAPPKVLRGHLRSLMDVEVEESAQRLFLRFYDPRILWTLLESFDALRLNHFLGPIQSVTTTVPQQKESNFTQLLAPYRSFGYMALRPFPLSQQQYQQVMAQCRQNLITDVAHVLHDDSETFSTALVNQLVAWGITQGSAIKSIAQMCVEHSVVAWAQFPTAWHQLLSQTERPADYRINRLQHQIRSAHGV